MFIFRSFIFLLLGLVTVLLPARGQDKSSSQDALKPWSAKLSGDVVTLPEESEVDKAFRALKTSYTTVMNAKKNLAKIEQLTQQNRDTIKQLMQQRSQVGRQMSAPGLSTQVHNSLVAQFTSLSDDINNRVEIDIKGEELSKAKTAYSTPRNQFMKAVIDLKTLIEKTKTKYETTADDTAMKKVMEGLSKTEKKTITLGPSKSHLQNVKDFARYEALVLIEDIPLEGRGGTHQLDVMLNGKAPIKMIFDTGASSISLSHDTARQAGIKVSEKDIDVRVTIANGRTVKAKMLKLESVRVGKFEVKNVECIVMPEDLPDSPPLLGGSFLNHFKYEVDAAGKKLRLSRIESGSTTSSKTK